MKFTSIHYPLVEKGDTTAQINICGLVLPRYNPASAYFIDLIFPGIDFNTCSRFEN